MLSIDINLYTNLNRVNKGTLKIDKNFQQSPNFKCRSTSIDYTYRKLLNTVEDIITPKAYNNIIKKISDIQVEPTSQYFDLVQLVSKLNAPSGYFTINTENKILEQIAKENESVIFMMTHSNQQKDPKMLAILVSFLIDAYKQEGIKEIPLQKIILNDDILATMKSTKRKAFEKMGAVGIDANIVNSNKGKNIRMFLPLLKDFINNKCNIFIFPEGKLALRTDLPLIQRLQLGIAEIINTALSCKKTVKVIPVSFVYGEGKQKGISQMQIGTPLKFQRECNNTTVTSGDITKDKNSCLFNFFNKHSQEENIVITSQGCAIPPQKIVPYIKRILCENLEINTRIAKEKIKLPVKEIKKY